MRPGSIHLGGVTLTLALATMLGACQTTNKSTATGEKDPAVHVNPAAVQARAKMPPPSTATSRTSLGQGKASVKTANSSGDKDSYWIETLDIDGDGTMEQTQLLWDDEDRVLFAYAQTDVVCENGGTAAVGLLVGVNGANNPRNRPAGSGFYAMDADAMECGAGMAGLYGCTFNARGSVTEWVAAVMDDNGDAIVLAGEDR